MMKIDDWLAENMHKFVGKKSVILSIKELNKIKDNKLTSHSSIKNQRMLQAELMNYAETLMNKRRKNIRLNRYKEVIVRLDPINNYQQRNDYIEKSINDTMKYFTAENIFFSDKEKKDLLYMKHLRRLLIKTETVICSKKFQQKLDTQKQVQMKLKQFIQKRK